MKTLTYLCVAIMLIACSKEMRECRDIVDVSTGEVLKTCCATFNKEAKLCKCQNEYYLTKEGKSKEEIKTILKESCD